MANDSSRGKSGPRARTKGGGGKGGRASRIASSYVMCRRCKARLRDGQDWCHKCLFPSSVEAQQTAQELQTLATAPPPPTWDEFSAEFDRKLEEARKRDADG